MCGCAESLLLCVSPQAAASGGSSAALCGLLAAVSPLAVEHGIQEQGLGWLWNLNSGAVAPGLSCFAACPMHWQAESGPLWYQGRPVLFLLLLFP